MQDNFITPAWTPKTLAEAEGAGTRLKYLLFWGHTPRADGAVGPHVLSQWFEQSFEHDGDTYQTAEHFMMAEKARLFGDTNLIGPILNSTSPGQAKALGRKVQGFTNQRWNEHRLDIVTRVSVAKFDATDELRNYLVGTGDRVLVEASPQDKIWGIGLARDDADATVPSKWQGLNLLGFALMNAREHLARR